MNPHPRGRTRLGTGNSACGSWGGHWTPTVRPSQGGASLTMSHTPGERAPGRPASLPTLRTCVIHLRVTGLGRPPTFPLRLLHLRHIEVSLPCQRAHEVDLVLLVDLQARVGTQLPLLVREEGEG